ncbi:hypothetical protein EYF80_059262 [Liparis tanakae]|uniref:Secreted protein n=1 Tax=Liparis tanakae TaxID=230148 RepID=A0A4Z2EP88_9TELE|nr:hypothetical protein EYF80_059262 [Liparis tanakae]
MQLFALFLIVIILVIIEVDLRDGLWAEVGQRHHALPLQGPVLTVQLQGGGQRDAVRGPLPRGMATLWQTL